MTTRQTPDAVREAVAKVLYDFRPGCGWKTVKGRPASYAIPWDEACADHKEDAYRETDAIIAALDSRAGDAGEGLKQQAHEWRRREVQAIGAAISTRSWHTVEQAYNSLRDKMDAAGCWHAPATPAPAVDAVPAGEDVDDWLRGDWYERWQDATENADEELMATLESLRGRVEQTIRAALSHGEGRK